MGFFIKDERLVVSNSGNPRDCYGCPCCGASTDCNCCNSPPTTIMLTVPTGTFSTVSGGCQGSGCNHFDGVFFLSASSIPPCNFRTTQVTSRCAGDYPGVTTSSCTKIATVPTVFAWILDLTAATVTVELRGYHGTTTELCVGGVQQASIFTSTNALPFLGNARYDCSLPATTLNWSTGLAQLCTVASTDKYVTVERA